MLIDSRISISIKCIYAHTYTHYMYTIHTCSVFVCLVFVEYFLGGWLFHIISQNTKGTFFQDL